MIPNNPSSSPAPRPNWISQNWKWAVPCGCVTGFVAILGFVAAICVFVFGAVFGMIKSSEPYQKALSAAKANAKVAAELGSPLEEGWFITGNINTTPASGEANLAIPISGPKGKGTIYVVATKSAGLWTYSTLQVEIKATKQRIDLPGTSNQGATPNVEQ